MCTMFGCHLMSITQFENFRKLQQILKIDIFGTKQKFKILALAIVCHGHIRICTNCQGYSLITKAKK